MAQASQVVLTPEHPFIEAVVHAVRRVYGEHLTSIAIFGSVARRSARPDSDLDLFLVSEQDPAIAVVGLLDDKAVGQALQLIRVTDTGHRRSLWDNVRKVLQEIVDLILTHRVRILRLNPRKFGSDPTMHLIGICLEDVIIGITKSIFQKYVRS